MDALLLAYLGALVHRNANDCDVRPSAGVKAWLDEFLCDAKLRKDVTTSLVKIGRCSAGCLIELLADADSNIRNWAEDALVALGDNALLVLQRVLDAGDSSLDHVARRIIDRISPPRVAS